MTCVPRTPAGRGGAGVALAVAVGVATGVVVGVRVGEGVGRGVGLRRATVGVLVDCGVGVGFAASAGALPKSEAASARSTSRGTNTRLIMSADALWVRLAAAAGYRP